MDRYVTMVMTFVSPIMMCVYLYAVNRSLTDFECPYITMQAINKTTPHRVTIRKW